MLALRPPPARAAARLPAACRPGPAQPRLGVGGREPARGTGGGGGDAMRQDRRRSPTSAAASGDDDAAPLLAALADISRTPLYRGPLQVAVFLVVFMIFDAAWSGDWSRIGAISKETEAALKPVTGAICAVHLASAGVAWTAASRRGRSPTVPTLKALAVGVLAGVEAWFDEGQG